MKVRDIMSDSVVTILTGSTVADAAKLMQQNNIGSVPVVNQNNEVIGIVTDRDITIRNIATGMDPKTTTVDEIMTKNVITVTTDTDIEEATDIMATDQVRRLPVVENNKIVGMVSLGDIALLSDCLIEAGSALSEISETK